MLAGSDLPSQNYCKACTKVLAPHSLSWVLPSVLGGKRGEAMIVTFVLYSRKEYFHQMPNLVALLIGKAKNLSPAQVADNCTHSLNEKKPCPALPCAFSVRL